MYADEDLIPISALQHHLFCERQCALIHVDGLWAENRLTVEGKHIHERSDTPGAQTRTQPDNAVRQVRAMLLVSRALGITGKADVVEFIHTPSASGASSGFSSAPVPRPVEHKRGRPKRLNHDRVQVAAQAMCLEDMLGVPVPEGELYYHAVRRRETVCIDQKLRATVKRLIAEVRQIIERNIVPPAQKKAKCRSCSLLHLCLPDGTGPTRDPARYLARSLGKSLGEGINGSPITEPDSGPTNETDKEPIKASGEQSKSLPDGELDR